MAQSKPIAQGIDITEFKQAKKALLREKHFSATVMNSSPGLLFVFDDKGNIIQWNRNAEKVTGYSAKEIAKMNILDFVVNEDQKTAAEAMQEVLTKGQSSLEIKILSKPGKKTPFYITGLRTKFENTTRVVCTGIDITERRKIENGLEKVRKELEATKILEDEAHEYAESLINTIREPLIALDQDLRVVTASRSFYDVFKVKPEETVGQLIYDLGNKQWDIPKLRELLETILPQKATFDNYEVEHAFATIGKRIMLLNARQIQRALGKERIILLAIEDITERKRAEDALRKSEDKLQFALDATNLGVWDLDLVDHTAYRTLGHDRIFGYQTLLPQWTYEMFLEHVLPEDRGEVNRKFREATSAQSDWSFECQIRRVDGEIRWIWASGRHLKAESGKTWHMLGSVQDITERKLAEEKLRQSKERFRALFEQAADCILLLEITPEGIPVIRDANKATFRLLGYERDELIGQPVSFMEAAPDASKVVDERRKNVLSASGTTIFEARHRCKDGTIRDFECSVTEMQIGSKTLAISVERDITERKQAERTLRESEARYRTLFQSTFDSILIADLETKIFRYANPAACRLLGYSETELTTIGVAAIHPKADLPRVMAEFEAQVRGDKTLAADLPCLRKDGTIVYADITAGVMTIDGRVCLVGFFRDITERKLAEEKLLRSEKRYRTIIESIEDGYFEVDLAGTFTFVNEAQCRNVGTPREQLLGKNNRAYTTEEEAKKLYQLFSGIYKTGEPVTGFDFEYRKRNGTMAFNEMSVSLIRDSKDKPVGFRGITRDVTERRQMEEALRETTNYLDSLISYANTPIIVWNPEFKITRFNHAFERLSGYTADEVIGQQLHMLFPEASRDESLSKIAHTSSGEYWESVEIPICRKDGDIRVALWNSANIHSNDGKIILATIAQGTDITDRKRAEEKLRQSEEKYRTILETMQESYYELDLVGRFTFVNDAICRHLGYSKEELMGTDPQQLQDETTAKKIDQVYREIYRTGESVEALETEYIRKDGTKGMYELSASLIRDAQGKPIGFRGISRDVSERKRAEEQLQRYAAELERSNEEVKNFAYIVSHDLRVPLINLKGYTSELRSALGVIGSNFDAALPHLNDEKRSAVATALHEDVPEALEFITSSVSRMDSFINAVLILSRLGRRDLKPEPIDMNALVQTTVETMSHQLQERGIKVIVGSLPQVVADRTSMEQIMGNILSNAVKYLDSSRPGQIEVTAQANGAETTFRIRDNGRGIAVEDMDKVFAPFRRAGKQDTPGEGMGLAYVQTLLRRHGGLISCESKLGKGTTFAFTIATRSEKGASDA